MPPAADAGYGPPVHAAGQYADMGKRFLARLIDLIILFVVFLVLFFVMTAVAGTDTADGRFVLTGGAFWLYQVLTWLIWLGYEVGMIAARGATIGKQLIGVKVVRAADGQVPGGSPAFLRWLIPFIGSFFCIGGLLVYVSPFFDNTGRRQGWHDKVAKTVVIATK
ncbi:MAG TPA: RDD family protein [Pseudonocardiaceae bacterium]|nr:RDD family protein [Pseudonocardiaceae bacterium]